MGDSQGWLCSLVKVLQECVFIGPMGPPLWAVPALGLLAPSHVLAILGSGCVQAGGGMGNSAQTKDVGGPAWTGIAASWIFDHCRLPLSSASKGHDQWTPRGCWPHWQGQRRAPDKPFPLGHFPWSVLGIVVLLLSNGFVFYLMGH